MKKIISIIGVGYVGLPLAIKFSKKYKVIGYDSNKSRIEDLKKDKDIYKDQIINKKNNKNLNFSNKESDIKNSDIFIVTVPTPVDSKNQPDLKHLAEASKIVGKSIKKNSIVIYESTVYPGCTEEICVPILERNSKLKRNIDFHYAYSPERINVGDKLHNLENIKKIVSASNKKTLNKVFKLYSTIIKAGVYQAESIKVAEAAKVIENTQRDLNIALVNELSIIFERLDINTQDVLNAASTKWNFIKYLPGLVGGHCVGVDPYYLTYKAKKVGYNPRVILSGRLTNDNMSKHIFSLTLKHIQKRKITKKNVKVLILGYSFKENCSDIRNSKVKDLVNFFLKENIETKIYDPLIIKSHLVKNHKKILIDDLSSIKNNFDVLILAVPHKIFLKSFDFYYRKFLKSKNLVFDIKAMLKKNKYSQICL
jgi:UDP-N-acetyl-D-galactosamine dehydrogenase